MTPDRADPDRLRLLRRSLGELLQLPPGERAARAEAALATAPELLPDLLRLLRTAESDDPALEPPFGAADEPGLAAIAVPGARLGAYELLHGIGRGGMGEVWLAARADGTFAQQVAIKFPRGDWRSPAAFARFEHERRLLARLDHPGIVRIVDGGQTANGRPWLAMQYVDGQPIDEWVRTGRLDAPAVIHLVLRVCAALDAAHRALVVHRDLKPSNILVRSDGLPVLVDFGIAGAVDEGAAAARRGAPCFATPRYASPEQLRGEPAAAPSDVYALACIVRELLPTAARPVDADLDAVLAAAARPDAAQRTPSVAAFAADLERWLAHEPVAARPPTRRHRAALLARRNPLAVAVAALFTVLLLGAFAVVSVSWRAEYAARLRSEAAERALAARFAQVREIVRALVFGVHDRIGTLPGAVPVRRFLVETALRHLNELEALATADQDLAAEIAEVHLRLSAVRGLRGPGSLGDVDGAIASAATARTLTEPRARSEARFARLFVRACQSLGDAARDRGDLDRAAAAYRDMADVARDGLARWPGDRALALATATAALQSGKLAARRGELPAALAAIDAACTGYAELAVARPDDRDAARNLGLAESERAFTCVLAGRRAAALADWRQALARFDALAQLAPDDGQLARDRVEVQTQIGLLLAELGEPDEAIAAIGTALAAARAQHAADTDNALAARTLERCLVFAARVRHLVGDVDGAVAHYAEAEALLRGGGAADTRDEQVRRDLLESLIMRGELERARGEAERAGGAFAAGLALASPDEALQRGDHLTGHLLTIAWLGLGQLALARQDFTAALQHFEDSRDAVAAWAERHASLDWPRRQLALHCYGSGSAHEGLAGDPARPRTERLALLQAARDDHARGLAIAASLRSEGRLLPFEADLPQLFEADVARVDAAIAALR